jgi:hypothetical protein
MLFRLYKRLKFSLSHSLVFVIYEFIPGFAEFNILVFWSQYVEPSLISVRVDTFHIQYEYTLRVEAGSQRKISENGSK